MPQHVETVGTVIVFIMLILAVAFNTVDPVIFKHFIFTDIIIILYYEAIHVFFLFSLGGERFLFLNLYIKLLKFFIFAFLYLPQK